MEILNSDEVKSERASVLAEARQNYKLAMLCILPGVESRTHRLKAAAKRMGVAPELFDSYQKKLLATGIWKRQGELTVSGFEMLELGDLTVADYLSMTVNIISRLSSEKSYEYETFSLATNRELVRGFVTKLNRALRELYSESNQPDIDKTVLFSWTHTGVIELEIKDKKLNGEGDEDASH